MLSTYLLIHRRKPALRAHRTQQDADAVARQALMFADPFRQVRPVQVNAAGVLVTAGRQPVLVMGFTVTDGKIIAIDALTDPARLSQLDLAALDD